MSPTENMTVQMWNGLAAVAAVVDDEAVAIFFETEFGGNFSGLEQQMTKELVIIRRCFGNARNWLLWDDQNMRRCLSVDVAKRADEIILKHNLGGNFACDDFFKQRLAHGGDLIHQQRARATCGFEAQALAEELNDLLSQGFAPRTPAACTAELLGTVVQAGKAYHGWRGAKLQA